MTDKERMWLDRACRTGGDFVKTFAMACFMADDFNFEILRTTLAIFMAKYPNYSRSI